MSIVCVFYKKRICVDIFFYSLIGVIAMLPLAFVFYMKYIKKREPSLLDYSMIAFLGLILLFVIMDLAVNLIGGNTIALLVTDKMPSLYNEVNATIAYPPTLSMEKMGQWGDFIGGHVNALSLIMLTLTVYLQLKNNLLQISNVDLDRIERLYQACDKFENEETFTENLRMASCDSVKNIQDLHTWCENFKPDHFVQKVIQLSELYKLIQNEIDKIIDKEIKQHEKAKFDILKDDSRKVVGKILAFSDLHDVR